mgnify:FL=1
MMDTMQRLHELYMLGICIDIINGTLLTKCSSDELRMILTEMYDDMSSYERLGVTIGKA